MFVQFTFNTGPLHPRSKTKPGGSFWKCTRTIRGILTPSQVFNNWSLNITKCQLKHTSLFWILPVWLETPGFQTLIYFPRWPCWEPSCRWQCGAPLRMHHQETGGCPNIQCPSFIFRQFLYLHKLWNLISSSLSDLGMVTGSFSHIALMKRTQSGGKIVFLQQYNDGNVTHQIHCLCSLMDRWNIINSIITCSGVLDQRQRVVCLKEVEGYL